jgi:purine-nucleoside phosphorylase
MTSLDRRLTESLAFIREHTNARPTIGLILGSGLGDFTDTLQITASAATKDIPHYPVSSVEGHKGKLVFATLGRKEFVAFQGRVHFYESNSLDSVLYPIRIAQRLGVKILLVTNAAGGLNRSFAPGDLMVITDQLNLTLGQSASISDQRNSRKSLYTNRLVKLAIRVAEDVGVVVRAGVYAGLKGPTYETAAEVEMVHRIGGDAVGMSTVLEVSLASELGMEVLGISCITNQGTGIGRSKLDHAEVTEVGNRVKSTFERLVRAIVEEL